MLTLTGLTSNLSADVFAFYFLLKVVGKVQPFLEMLLKTSAAPQQ